MRKRTIGITIFGVVFIILGLFSVFLPLIIHEKIKVISSMGIEDLSFVKYLSLIISPFSLAGGIVFIIIGTGIFKLRFWAWYLVIADQIITVIGLPNTGFIYGWQVYNPLKLAIQIGLIVFTLWFFMRPKIKEQFSIAEERFKIKSWYAILIILWLIMTLVIPVSVLKYKVFITTKGIQPFFVKKPQIIELPRSKLRGIKKRLKRGKPRGIYPVLELRMRSSSIKLEKADRLSLEDKFKKREIFNLSFLVPKDFVLLGFNKKIGTLILRDITDIDKGVIMVDDKLSLDFTRGIYKAMGFKNTYEFEEALYSNNWGIILFILRDIGVPDYGDDTQIRKFDISEVKGFIKYGYRKDEDKWIYGCSIYDKFNNGIGNITLILKGKNISQDEVLMMISSIRISKEEDAEGYYQKGLQLLDKGDSINAQFAFAKAYYLADLPEAGYMLAKTILMNGKQKFNLTGAERILKEVLVLKPDYPVAKDLLSLVNKEIETIEGKEPK